MRVVRIWVRNHVQSPRHIRDTAPIMADGVLGFGNGYHAAARGESNGGLDRRYATDHTRADDAAVCLGAEGERHDVGAHGARTTGTAAVCSPTTSQSDEHSTDLGLNQAQRMHGRYCANGKSEWGEGEEERRTWRSIQQIRIPTLSTAGRVSDGVDTAPHAGPFVEIRFAQDDSAGFA